MKRIVSLLTFSLVLFFALSGVARAQDAPDFDLTITITDQGGGETPLTIGLDPNASNGYEDDNIGPPALPPGNGFAALISPDGQSNNFITDTRQSVVGPATFEYEFIYQSGNSPVEISWDNTVFPVSVDAEIVDPFTGESFQYDMNANSSLTVDPSSFVSNRMIVRFNVLAAPEAPSGLGAAAASATQVNLDWDDNADDETSFEIERADDAGGPFSALATLGVNAAAYADDALSPATEYCYRVRAVNSIGASDFSAVTCATTELGTFDFDPAALSFELEEGTGPAQQSVLVAGTPAAGQSVTLAVQGGAPAWLTVPTSVTEGQSANLSADAGALTPGTYTATVTASSDRYEDAALNVTFNVTAALEEPSDLNASAASATQVGLSWTDNADEEENFEIERAVDGGAFTALATLGANATSYTDEGLAPATAYCYRVRATNGDGPSAFSGEACATTPAGTLSLTPDALSFTLVEGSGSDHQSFTVSSSIEGITPTVTLGVQGGAPEWLTVPTSVTAGQSARLSADAGALAVGTYTATVTASADGFTDAAFDVTLNVREELETDFTFVFEVSDTNGASIDLELGTGPEASEGEDALDLGAPPPPIKGAFDARFEGYGEGLFRDYRPTTTNSTDWVVQFVASSGGAPVTLDWSGATFPDEGRFTLVDNLDGSFVNVNMREQNSYTINLLTLDELKIVYSLTSVVDVAFEGGWNMVSLPLDVADKNYTSVFSNPVPESQPFGFSNAYEQVAAFELGTGYWVKFESDNTQTLEGFDVPSLALDLSAGWNMIGGVSCDVPLSSVSDPNNIIEDGTLFKFDLAYNVASVIEQSRGYWIKVSEDGQIVLDCAEAANAPAVAAAQAKAAEATEGMGRLSFKDADGVRQTLLMGTAPAGRSFAMPPLPPRGVFDARFAGDTRLLEEAEGLIEIQASAYPLKVQLDGVPDGYVLEELRGGTVAATHPLSAGEAVVLADPSVSMLRLRAAGDAPGMPESFGVRGNAPNPFSGSTTLTMDLPEKAQVAVDVYDVLGRRVLSLPGRSVEAGSGQALRLDAAALTPGLYLYRVQAHVGGEVITKTGRMTLVR